MLPKDGIDRGSEIQNDKENKKDESFVEQFLCGTSLSAAVARQAGALAIANAQPLAKNGHKLPMTSAAVERALMRLAPAWGVGCLALVAPYVCLQIPFDPVDRRSQS